MDKEQRKSLANYGIRIRSKYVSQKITLIHSMLGGHFLTYEVSLGWFIFPPLKIFRLQTCSRPIQATQSTSDIQRIGGYLFNDGYEIIRYTLQANFEISLRKVIREVCLLKLLSSMEIGLKAYKPMGFDIIMYSDCVEYCRQTCYQRKEPIQNINMKKQYEVLAQLDIEGLSVVSVFSKSRLKHVFACSNFDFQLSRQSRKYKSLIFKHNLQPYNNCFLQYIRCKRREKSLAKPEKLDEIDEVMKKYSSYEVPIWLDDSIHEQKYHYEYINFEKQQEINRIKENQDGNEENFQVISMIKEFCNEHSIIPLVKVHQKVYQIDKLIRKVHFTENLLQKYKLYLKIKLIYIKPYNSSYEEYENMVNWLIEYTDRGDIQEMIFLIRLKQEQYCFRKYSQTVVLYKQLEEKYLKMTNYKVPHSIKMNKELEKYGKFIDDIENETHLNSLMKIIEKGLGLYKVDEFAIQPFIPPFINEFKQKLASISLKNKNQFSQYFYAYFKEWISLNGKEKKKVITEKQCEYDFQSNCRINQKPTFKIRNIQTIQILALFSCFEHLEIDPLQISNFLIDLFSVLTHLELPEQQYAISMQIFSLADNLENKKEIWAHLIQQCYCQQTMQKLPYNILPLFYSLNIEFEDNAHYTLHDFISQICLKKLEHICHTYHIYLELKQQQKLMKMVNQCNKIMTGIQYICDVDDENERVQRAYWEGWGERKRVIVGGDQILKDVGTIVDDLLEKENKQMVILQLKQIRKKLNLTG